MSNYFWNLFIFIFSATCPRGWLLVTNSSCYGFSKNALTWYSAKSACEELGTKFVVLNTEAEQQALSPLVAQKTWIGLHRDPRNKSRWLWVDGSSADYTNWNRGEPNNYGGKQEDCAEMYSTSSPAGKWNDESCGVNNYYVCEISGKCENTIFQQAIRPPFRVFYQRIVPS